MAIGVPLAVLVAVQAAAATGMPAAYGPAAPAPPKPAAATAPVPAGVCPAPDPGNGREIVICAERPQGYRLDPDVMEAKRELRSPGRPVRPGGGPRPDCASVGPAPCVSAGINLVGAALTAVAMAEKAVKGENVGEMFVTDPHPGEYQLYLMAKARREAEDAQKAAAAVKADATARAEAGAKAVQAGTPAQSAGPSPGPGL